MESYSQVRLLLSKVKIGWKALKMNYLKFSFCQNEIPAAVKLCSGAAAALSPDDLFKWKQKQRNLQEIQRYMFVFRKKIEKDFRVAIIIWSQWTEDNGKLFEVSRFYLRERDVGY